ncbi:ABC-type transport auxiliary lipoprotein family protein [Dokdonella ginsengisoli]|uniref:ABC-type transport auxiliary lipoprotein family protein n=1 Tax=Dokdonella ginsengisoli TaxID=363846 RepID=A0ABV9R2K0_9GAMM
MSTRLRLSLLPLAFVLASCSSLLNVQRTPFTTYSPRYLAAAATQGGPRVDWQLVVDTPSSSGMLDSVRMLASPVAGELEVFPKARWRDPAPTLLRSLIIEGFESSGRIVGVGSATSGLGADYALAIELRDFQLEIRDGAPRAAVRFQARLFDYVSNRVVATQAFAQETPAAGSDAASAFAAFESGLNAVIPQLVDWTLREGGAARAKTAGK